MQTLGLRSRKNFIKPAKIAKQYDIGKTKLYEMLKNPVFSEAVIKVGEDSIRVDQDKFYEVLTQYYR